MRDADWIGKMPLRTGTNMTQKIDRHLETIDADRRAAILKLVKGAAFAVPVVASFAIDGRMSIASAGPTMSNESVSSDY